MRTNLRNARRTAGFSQGELADIVGLTQQAVSKHELAASVPGHFTTIRLYENALNVPAEHLFPDIFNH
jgi:transcriptional regulator with XRE-family HTH domain